MNLRFRHVALGFVAGAIFMAANTAPQAASAATASVNPKPRVVCTQETHADAASHRGTAYAVRPGNWATPLCLRINGKPDFTIIGNVLDLHKVVAFPSVLYGCFATLCTQGTALPRKISKLGAMTLSWWTHGHPAGIYNRAADMWLTNTHWAKPAKGKVTVPHGTAEVMIWIDTQGYASWAKYPKVRVDGATWYYDSWETHPATGKGWPITIFRRVRPTRHASGLKIRPFLRAAIARHDLSPGDEVLSVAAGSEMSTGGNGLGVSNMRVTP